MLDITTQFISLKLILPMPLFYELKFALTGINTSYRPRHTNHEDYILQGKS